MEYSPCGDGQRGGYDVYKHQKPTREKKGGIITIERPIDISNVVKLSDAKVEKKVEKKEVAKKTVKEEKPKTKSKK
jgi:large subunit ribosomal protein L24